MDGVSNPDFELAPALIELAGRWELFPDFSERNCQRLPIPPRCDLEHDDAGRHLAPIMRCRACEEEVYPTDQNGVLRHLLTSHGYRMDGRQFDNQNRLVGRV